MIILDENIVMWQSELLRRQRIHHRQIGIGIGRKGMKDQEQIIPLLQGLRRSTFSTGDRGFYKAHRCHERYCLAFLDVPPDETAEYIRRFLHHPVFRTHAKRMGNVVRVSATGVGYWQMNDEHEHIVSW